MVHPIGVNRLGRDGGLADLEDAAGREEMGSRLGRRQGRKDRNVLYSLAGRVLA